jgi:hypothetical protein
MDINDHIYDKNDERLAELEVIEEVSAEECGIDTFDNGRFGHCDILIIGW